MEEWKGWVIGITCTLILIIAIVAIIALNWESFAQSFSEALEERLESIPGYEPYIITALIISISTIIILYRLLKLKKD